MQGLKVCLGTFETVGQAWWKSIWKGPETPWRTVQALSTTKFDAHLPSSQCPPLPKRTQDKTFESNQDVLQWVNGLISCGTPRQCNIISVLKRNELMIHEKIWRNLKCMLLSERKQSEKGYIWLYVSNCRTFWKRQNYEESKKISSCQGLVGNGQ